MMCFGRRFSAPLMSLGPGGNLISPSAEHTCHRIANVELMTTGRISNQTFFYFYYYYLLPDKPCPVFHKVTSASWEMFFFFLCSVYFIFFQLEFLFCFLRFNFHFSQKPPSDVDRKRMNRQLKVNFISFHFILFHFPSKVPSRFKTSSPREK